MKYLFILSALCIFSSCVSMSTLQTARTLKPGETQQTFGGGVFESKTEISGASVTTSLPYAEYSYRRGFIPDLDAGLKLTLIGAYQGDVKYQLFTSESFAASIGGGISFMSYKVSTGTSDEEVKFIDAIIPVYLSYDVNSSWSLYFAPKYIFRSASGAESGSDSIVGATVGTKIGDKKGVYLEASVMKGKDENAITQYNASYFW